MKKKIAVLFLVIICAFCSAFGVVACDSNENISGSEGEGALKFTLSNNYTAIYTFNTDDETKAGKVYLELYYDGAYVFTDKTHKNDKTNKNFSETGTWSYINNMVTFTKSSTDTNTDISSIMTTVDGDTISVNYVYVTSDSTSGETIYDTFNGYGSVSELNKALGVVYMFTPADGNTLMYLTVYADDTYTFGYTAASISESGTWTYSEDVLTLTSEDDETFTAAIENGVMTIEYDYGNGVNETFSGDMSDFESGIERTADYVSNETAYSAYYTVSMGTFDSTEIVIPSEYNGVEVKAIAEDAFADNTSITSVTIPTTITTIGEGAFDGCKSLTSVYISDIQLWFKTEFGNVFSNPLYYAGNLYLNGELVTAIPENTTSVGAYSMAGWNIERLTIPDSVTYIGEYAFFSCKNMTSVTIGSEVTEIGEKAFYGCEQLTDVNITDLTAWCGISFGSSSANPLYYADKLNLNGERITSLVIPDGVTAIGDYAFYNCTAFVSITIPESAKSIGDYTFYKCTAIAELVIPDGVTDIGYNAFGYCSNLENLSIGNGVTTIGDYAFYNCVCIKDLIIPDSVITIGNRAFCSCTSLERVTISANAQTIGNSAFSDCYALTDIIIPDSVTSIGAGAFYDCSSLAGVTIGNGVKTIGDRAFYGCELLTDIVIPDSVISVGAYAFCNCNLITKIVIPDSVTEIGAYAFYDCISLKSVVLGKSVKSIGENAFYGCYYLVEVYNLSALDFTEADDDNDYYGYVWYYAINVYTNKNETSRVFTQGDYTFISGTDGNYYLIYYTGIQAQITLPQLTISGNTVNYEINDYAFYNSGLQRVTIPDGITAIGSYAFYGCSSLESIIIPDSVTQIGEGAFYGCTSLEEISIPDKVTAIGAYAFYGCSSLKSITIPDEVTEIEEYTFYGCTSLTEVNLSANIEEIGDQAFYGCSSLISIIIPAKVAYIGKSAFGECTSLSSVTFENTENWQVAIFASSNGSGIDVGDASQNAENLKDTYSARFWKRVTA